MNYVRKLILVMDTLSDAV